MITEKHIENVLLKVEKDHSFLADRIQFYSKKYPAFFRHINEESFILSGKEIDYLVGLIGFILEVTVADYLEDGDLFAELEEENWTIVDSLTGFKSVMDHWFSETQEEELLAYIEDSLVEDEEDFISKEGRLFIAVKCKTLVDVFTSFE